MRIELRVKDSQGLPALDQIAKARDAVKVRLAHRAQYARPDLVRLERDDQEQAGDPRIFFVERRHRVEHPQELGAELDRVRRVRGFFEDQFPFAEHLGDDRDEEFFFVGEMPIERALGDARRARDSRQRGAAISVRREQIHRRVDQDLIERPAPAHRLRHRCPIFASWGNHQNDRYGEALRVPRSSTKLTSPRLPHADRGARYCAARKITPRSRRSRS